MIWIDIDTPKYALFFASFYKELKKIDPDIWVTTRSSPGYTETEDLLKVYNIPATITGVYGGQNIQDKFLARLNRQKEFVELIKEKGTPRALLCGGVVDSIQTAYGLGIPICNFYDTPLIGGEVDLSKLTHVTRLTTPLSSLFFHPFVLPRSIYKHLGLQDEQIITHNFIDVCLWMKNIKRDSRKDFRKKYNLDLNKPTILLREEEYKASYVKKKTPLFYDLIPLLKEHINANLVIFPRYEHDELVDKFSAIATVITDKLNIDEYYPFIDMLIGGGGTMNLEAVYYGIPTISLRSLWLIHDKYLIDNQLMHWTDDANKAIELVKQLLGKRIDSHNFFCKGECSPDIFVKNIASFLSKHENNNCNWSEL